MVSTWTRFSTTPWAALLLTACLLALPAQAKDRQGATASLTGARFEASIRDLLEARGFRAVPYGDWQKRPQAFAEAERLVLLDACRSGAATEDGADLTVDARLLRTALATSNITVLTSSSRQENSIEHEAWKNGAFTEVFLEALGHEGDTDRNGVISMSELIRYLTAGVPRLVRQVRPQWHQTPGLEVRLERTILPRGRR